MIDREESISTELRRTGWLRIRVEQMDDTHTRRGRIYLIVAIQQELARVVTPRVLSAPVGTLLWVTTTALCGMIRRRRVSHSP